MLFTCFRVSTVVSVREWTDTWKTIVGEGEREKGEGEREKGGEREDGRGRTGG